MNRSLPLNALQVFNVAASELSFARAADRLFVTHGAVSRQIRTLEDALGLPLFERRNRAVFLTPAGERLHTTTRQMFEQLASTVASLRTTSPARALVVSCEPTLAMRWFIPRLGAFAQMHPDIALHLHSAGGPLDLASAGVDIAIRRNDFFWGHTLVAEPLADEWIGPVGLPASFDTPHLKQLHTRSRPHAWQDWHRATSPRQTAVDEAPHLNASRTTATPPFEHFYLSLQAAGAGLGTAIGSVYMVSDELNAGRLVAPYGFVRDGSAYVALAREPFAEDPARETLLHWLRATLAESASQWISGVAPAHTR
ncbi:LysR family transcriptional regulator [Pandoraea bronchicola]|uniref:LysR family transcriptional regulator n=1 Tax=Pandoraea bronchicola TaxID=2508287 RepID=A0A5E5BWG4_9BURK|nr:LysR family transcriptional regulator [Pandoraea bronchicola]VVE89345.1 LysR family transcriptional regulator [Pandoraea bronchicola]